MTIKLSINFPRTHYTPTVFFKSTIIIILMWPLMSPGTTTFIYIYIYIYSCFSFVIDRSTTGGRSYYRLRG